MKLTIVSPMGLKNSELRAIDRIKKELPDSWQGYASFLMSDGIGAGMEIDLLLITADRFIVCEIKEWKGEVRSDGKYWIQTVKDTERSQFSPVEVKRQHAMRINTLLDKSLKSLWGTWYKVDFVVVMAGSAKFSQLSPTDKDNVLTLDQFCQIGNPAKYQELLPTLPYSVTAKFTSGQALRPNNQKQIDVFDRWRKGGNAVKKRFRTEFNYEPTSEKPTFVQPVSKAYSEYVGTHKQSPANKALMRFWDFAQLGTYACTTEQRANIGLREQNVILYVAEKNDLIKRDFLMEPLHNYGLEECSEDMVEVYRHSPSLTRLNLHLVKTPNAASSRLELLRQLLAPIAGLHSLDVAHRDISLDRLWFDDVYKKIVVSGLCTAKFPEELGMKSISDFYSTLSTRIIRPPEDVFGVTDGSATTIDVYQLGVLAYEIAFNQKLPLHDDVYEWVKPSKDIFDGLLDEWIQKAINLEPKERFNDANDMLSELNLIQLEAHPDAVDDSQIVMTELQKYYQAKFPMVDWKPVGSIEQDTSKGKTFYRSSLDDVTVRVQWWPQLAPQPNQTGQNRRLLQFLKRCQIFKENELSAPKVLDFATTHMGVYVVSEFAEGITLDTWILENKESEDFLINALNVGLSLAHAVNQIHDIGVGHGDLKPDNILVKSIKNEEGTVLKYEVVLIDCLDINYLAEIPQNFLYAPNAQATILERDRYAVYRIIKEVIPETDVSVKGLHLEIKHKIGEGFDQTPLSIDPLTKTINEILESLESTEIPSNVLTFWHPELRSFQNDFLFKSDQGRFYVSVKRDTRIQNQVMVFVAGLSKKLTITGTLEGDKFAVKHANLRVIPPSELIQSSNFANSNRFAGNPPILKQEIHIDASNSTNTLITTILELTPIRKDLRLEVSEHIATTRGSARWLQRLWTTLLDAEESLHPIVVTKGAPFQNKGTGGRSWTIPITTPAKEFDFDADSEIRVVERTDRAWTLGTIDLAKSDFSQGRLVITAFSSNSKTFSQFEGRTELSLQDFQASSSQERRKRALERVLNGEALIPNLVQYFGIEVVTEKDDLRPIALPAPDVMKHYLLDDNKVEALHKILNQRVSVVVGPPGTGKTQLLAYTLDHLNRQPEIKRILLVSQSNVAVDEVASKARKTIHDMALLEGKDPLDVLPSMVRLGDRQKVNESLHDIHVEALQGQYRTRFYREFELRMLAFCPRLGVSHEYMLEVSKLYRAIGRELYDYKKDINDLIEAGPEVASEPGWKKRQREMAEKRKNRLELILLKKLLAYTDEPQIILDLDDPMQELINAMGAQNGIHNPDQLGRIGQLLSISHQWLIRLDTDVSGFASFMSKTRQWIIGTLVGIGRPSYNIKENQYDIAIIDEAGRASANELAMAMQSARRVVLVGDYLQLPPVYDMEVVKLVSAKTGLVESEVRKTDFERAFKATKGYMLSTQYRMAQPIGDLISHVFYESEPDMGKLATGREIAEPWLKDLAMPWNKVVNWIDTSGLIPTENKNKNESRGIANQTEVGIIQSLLRNLIKGFEEDNSVLSKLRAWAEKDRNPPIGIITGYNMQVKEIEKIIENDGVLHNIRDLIRIDTIDSYQGSENRIILLSLVRHNEKNSTGFMEERPRINVAISRAQERLIIIGATQMWVNANEGSPMGQVYQYINERINNENSEYQIIKMNELTSNGALV